MAAWSRVVQNMSRICGRRGLQLSRPGRYLSSLPEAEADVLKVNLLEGAQEGIAVIGFNRPEAKNAISRVMLTRMEEAVEAMAGDPGVRVVILRSMAPGIFCAGADLKERAKMTDREVGPFVARLRRSLRSFQELPQPTIAALDGVALGGGIEIAMTADMRIAADSARLGLTETKLAIIPGGGGTQNLPRLVGKARAKELIFTGRAIGGEEAASIGLVNHCVAQNAAGDAAYLRAVELAEEILPQGPVALRAAKIAINRGSEVDLFSGYGFEEACYSMTIPTQDRMEALKAFREKRKPQFQGK